MSYIFQQVDKDCSRELSCEDYSDEPLTVDLDENDVILEDGDGEEGGEDGGAGEEDEIDIEDEGYSECQM